MDTLTYLVLFLFAFSSTLLIPELMTLFGLLLSFILIFLVLDKRFFRSDSFLALTVMTLGIGLGLLLRIPTLEPPIVTNSVTLVFNHILMTVEYSPTNASLSQIILATKNCLMKNLSSPLRLVKISLVSIEPWIGVTRYKTCSLINNNEVNTYRWMLARISVAMISISLALLVFRKTSRN